MVAIGMSIRTLPTVKPRTYAGKVGTVATVNDGEIGVLVNGRVVWFLEKEIEICQSTKPTLQSMEHARAQSTDRVPADGADHRDVPTNEHARTRGSMSAPSTTPGTTRDARLAERPSAEPSTRAREGNPASPVAVVRADSRGEEGREGQSVPEPVSAASRGSGEEEQLILGERGPGGGVVAQCVTCGAAWERERRRGRPSLNCPRCR